MRLVYPSYYPDFSCIADRCRHSCCIGWEIALDAETAEKYRRAEGALGDRVRACMEETAEGVHFRLTEEERCPFLNEKGLCRLILEWGEEALCQICADHPRFRSFYTDRTEIGLGLCCEEAARLILKRQEKTELINDCESSDPEEAAFFAFRQELISLSQDRTRPLKERMERIRRVCGLKEDGRTPAQWAAFYLSLESMEAAWTDRLTRVRAAQWPAFLPERERALEQVLVYFLYRHLPGGLEDGCYAERAAFCLLSTRMIDVLAGTDAFPEALAESARMYSAQIEYSDENVQLLLEKQKEGCC